ncbi:MAG: methyltransferase domain-containing protein [Woeseiaceae bacterium]
MAVAPIGEPVVSAGVTARDSPGLLALHDFFACPACRSTDISYSERRSALVCEQCNIGFPVFRSGNVQVPWLFDEPTTARLEWKARYHGFLHENSLELERLRKARGAPNDNEVRRDRIARLLQAREQHRRQVSDILSPLELDGMDWPADGANLLHGKLPRSQGLSSYVDNVFRDWAWDNGENEALLAAVESVLGANPGANLGSVLTLGAGACRLPYDLHRRYAPTRSVVVDLNPLLLLIGREVICGGTVPLYEFPIAPLDASSFAVPQELSAPVPLDGENFHFVIADATKPPIAAGSFDTVITPWLIDIIPQDLRTFIPQVNHCLKDGGIWVNTGSLAFFHNDETWRYSEEEVVDLLEQNGFLVLAAERTSVPYMRSPHSAHGRRETIFSFSARKLKDVSVPSPREYLPDWILDTAMAVPASTEAAISSSHHLLKAQVLAEIDGKRTIRQISRSLARQYGLGKQETVNAVQRILLEAWQKSTSGNSGGDF